MRRIDLANELQLSPSGITRLLDRLMDQGLVGRGECGTDARVSYAVLTDEGLNKLKQAAPDHVDEIERRLGAILDKDEIETLAGLLSRLSDGEPGPCEPE
jgi:MarR family transcriptional regulator, 2-MHQ and catechol-resistance regulon repressor